MHPSESQWRPPAKDRPGPIQEFLTLQKMASLGICTGTRYSRPTYSLTASPAGSYLGCLLPLLTDLHGESEKLPGWPCTLGITSLVEALMQAGSDLDVAP